MNLTYYGHSCFAVTLAGKTLLFDPFITPNELAKGKVDVNAVPADYVLLTHGHFDHVQDAVAIARRTGATVITPFEVGQWLGKQGVEKVHAANHGGSARLDFGRVQLVNAVHSSSLPDGTYGGNAVGFVVDASEGAFYYSGDTALTYDMQLIAGSTSRPLDFAVLCIGDHFTMGVDDAVRAADFVRVDRVVGVHYDTFPPIKLDHARATERFQAAGKKLLLPAIGETISL